MSNWVKFDRDTVTNLDHVGRFDISGVERDEITFFMPDMVSVLKTVSYSSCEVAAEKFRQLSQMLSMPYTEFNIKE